MTAGVFACFVSNINPLNTLVLSGCCQRGWPGLNHWPMKLLVAFKGDVKNWWDWTSLWPTSTSQDLCLFSAADMWHRYLLYLFFFPTNLCEITDRFINGAFRLPRTLEKNYGVLQIHDTRSEFRNNLHCYCIDHDLRQQLTMRSVTITITITAFYI